MHGPTHRPFTVAVLFLQPQCNMTCTFCVTEDDFDVMDVDRAVESLEWLEAHGVRTVTFGGGEPFDWPGDVSRLARVAKGLGLRVQVGTNGVALPDDFQQLECFDRWILPLESIDPGVHERMRLYQRRHQSVILERLEALREVSKSVTISTVLTAVNEPSVLDLAEFLRRYQGEGGNIHAWHLYRFLPLGRGGARNRAALEIPEARARALCTAVKVRDLPFTVFSRPDMYRSRTVEFFWQKDGRIVSGSEALHAEGRERTQGTGRIS